MSMICELFAVTDKAAGSVLEVPTRVHDLLAGLDEGGTGVSLEKSWHGLHFTLTGDAWGGEPPLNFLVLGGEPVGAEDVGYGPARVLRSAEVISLNSSLHEITDEEFARRFDLKQLAAEDVYPQIWDEPREDLLEEYLGYLNEAKEIIGKAAREGQALLVVIR